MAKARGGDPLPTFANAEQYKNYVINLVAQARATQADLDKARNGANNQAEVGNLKERLDSVKLQLAVLRDNFPIPADWSRSKLLFGQGFDKDKFWREQVEAIPGKEVVITPAPQAPAPQAPAPAPAPAVTNTRPTPAPQNAGGELPAALVKLLQQHAADGINGNNSTSGITYMRGHLDAIRQLTRTRSDEQSRQVDAVAARGLAYKAFNSEDYYAMYCADLAIIELLGGKGTLDDRARTAMKKIAGEGINGNNSTSGITYMRSRLAAVADLASGRQGEDFAGVARLSRSVLNENKGFNSADYYALFTGFQSVSALLNQQGTVTDRDIKAIRQITADGVNGNNSTSGITWMRSRLYAITRLTQGSADGRLQAVEGLAQGALKDHPGFNTPDWQAFQATFQAIQATLS
jgi:hypothetical protein